MHGEGVGMEVVGRDTLPQDLVIGWETSSSSMTIGVREVDTWLMIFLQDPP